MSGGRWSEAEIEHARKLHEDGVPIWEIGEAIGRSAQSVETKLLLKPKRKRTSARSWTEADLTIARRMRADGASLKEIGDKLGRSPHGVATKLSRTRVGRTYRDPGPIANASGKAMANVLRRRGWVCLPPVERCRLEGLECTDPRGYGDSCTWASPERRVDAMPVDALGGFMLL